MTSAPWENDTWIYKMHMTDEEFDSQPMPVIPYDDDFKDLRTGPGLLRRIFGRRYTPRHAKALYWVWIDPKQKGQTWLTSTVLPSPYSP